MDTVKSGKGLQEEEEDDEEDFMLKKDSSSHKDGKSDDRKANTSRSKHSVSEQRRRCKINERFQILREIIPDSDIKRDKASFLLEVIQYIQFLQEKVQNYESSYQGVNQEPLMKLMPWRNSLSRGESMVDHSRTTKNGSNSDGGNIEITPTTVENPQNLGDSDLSLSAAHKTMDYPSSLNKEVPLTLPLKPNIFAAISRNGVPSQRPQKSISEADNMASQTQSQLWHTKASVTERPITSEALNEQEEPTIERARINISSAYSQGLLNSLTQALQNSGVDLSQASFSVQIDLGKQATSELARTTSTAKDQDDPSFSDRTMSNSRIASSGEDSDQAQKRLKTDKRYGEDSDQAQKRLKTDKR